MPILGATRPVFHSEADFQFAFAQSLARLDPSIEIRLEVRQPIANEYVDLIAYSPSRRRRTLVEFKYPTARWEGEDPHTGETFRLRGHAAMDLARHGFVHDIYRLERFIGEPATLPAPDRYDDYQTVGLAVLLTNDSSLWKPRVNATSRDREFRLHEGRRLGGTLIWGEGDYAANDRILDGTYDLAWRPYAALPGPRGEFRYLAVRVQHSSRR